MSENPLQPPNVLLNFVNKKEYLPKIYLRNVLSHVNPCSLCGDSIIISGSSQKMEAKHPVGFQKCLKVSLHTEELRTG